MIIVIIIYNYDIYILLDNIIIHVMNFNKKLEYEALPE